MDEIFKLFAAVEGWIGLFAVLLFGISIGLILGRLTKKQWPPEYEDLNQAVEKTSRALIATDTSIDVLWKQARHRLENRTRLQAMMTSSMGSPSRVHSLTVKLLNLSYQAKRIAIDAERVRPWLRASETEQCGDTGKEASKGSQIPVGRRDPNDTDPWYYEAPDNEFIDDAAVSIAPDYSGTKGPQSPAPFDSQWESTGSLRELVNLYNRAVTDQPIREEFRERFQPLRIGALNAVERSQNPTLSPEIKETTDGTLFASALSGDRYAVVPRLGLTIEAVCYGPGALGEVFGKTVGHDPKLFYSRYHVIEPAILKKYSDGNWEIESAGKLELGTGD